MNLYLYVLDTMADWEFSYLLPEVNSRRYFSDKSREIKIIKVGKNLDPILTMGGLSIKPDISIKDLKMGQEDILVLPGGETWLSEEHLEVLQKAKSYIEQNYKVAAICGATLGLASVGALNQKAHTSIDKEYVQSMCKEYSGGEKYLQELVCVDGRLITASGLAPIEFTYEILKSLAAFSPETLEAWKNLFLYRKPDGFMKLMITLHS